MAPWASSLWQVNPLQQGLRGRSLERKAQGMLAGVRTGKRGAETAARPKQGAAPGGGASLGKGARLGGRGGGGFVGRGGEGGKAGELGRKRTGASRPRGCPPAAARRGDGAHWRRFPSPGRPGFRPGWAGRVALGAGLRFPTFPPSLPPPGAVPGGRANERREEGSGKQSAPGRGPPTAPGAAAPTPSLRPWSLRASRPPAWSLGPREGGGRACLGQPPVSTRAGGRRAG